MGRKANCAAMVYCLRCIYLLIGQRHVVSGVSATNSHSHSPLIVHCAVIPVIRLAARWCNHSSTFSMDPVTTRLLISYNNANCKIALEKTLASVSFPPSSSQPSPPSPTVAVPSKDSETGPPRHYCYMRLCSPGMEILRTDPEHLRSRWFTPDLPWKSVG